MDELLLKQALEEADYFLLQQTPARAIYKHDFSKHFQRKIHSLIRREKMPFFYKSGKAIAGILILLTVAGGVLLGTNAKVRADFTHWFMRMYDERVFGYYSNSEQEADVSRYTMKNVVPTEYELVDSISEDGLLTEIYVNSAGEIMTFVAVAPDRNHDFYIASDEDGAAAPIAISELNAQLYLAKEEGEANVIVWTNEDGILFSISGLLEQQELMSYIGRVNK